MGRAWLWKGGAGKTLGCRANARNVREATHAPSEPSKPISQSEPPLRHPLGHAGSLTALLLLLHLLLLLSPLLLLLLLRFFLLFFTLTAH